MDTSFFLCIYKFINLIVTHWFLHSRYLLMWTSIASFLSHYNELRLRSIKIHYLHCNYWVYLLGFSSFQRPRWSNVYLGQTLLLFSEFLISSYKSSWQSNLLVIKISAPVTHYVWSKYVKTYWDLLGIV